MSPNTTPPIIPPNSTFPCGSAEASDTPQVAHPVFWHVISGKFPIHASMPHGQFAAIGFAADAELELWECLHDCQRRTCQLGSESGTGGGRHSRTCRAVHGAKLGPLGRLLRGTLQRW